ncbi:LysR family transcriptional regulator, chromosome initiation inhibitor [Marinospirillum celere]|uniref:LysR family transcriptional regulator, chromosome initiation inhibitor n=1 Tax=Marinospirillum celere TaxID=1122252 RepID=A0A1I1JJD8_9GAMM|nr:LysR family transcriptional regulator ArgP [Marinospirillum celere]SFC45580.1 LysR family transcriptional regulator, chromosome initiation inhibitor [Marinospirillum celere]
MLDYRLLEALAAVIETGGFEKAAQKLHLTQSAVSQRLQQLERRLGQPVVLRSSPPVATPLGRRLNNHLQQVKQLELGLIEEAQDEPLKVRLTVNADSMATWLAEGLAASSLSSQMDFDLVVEDQEVGLNRMRNGEVMACICADSQAVNGGAVSPLGVLRYRALASPDFVERHQTRQYPHQLVEAPCLIFNQDDRLQHRFLEKLKLPAPKRQHRCPSSEGFVQMALMGLGYGMLPEIQVQDALKEGKLIDVAETFHLDIPLYWHYWQTESAALAELRRAVIEHASKVLNPVHPYSNKPDARS